MLGNILQGTGQLHGASRTRYGMMWEFQNIENPDIDQHVGILSAETPKSSTVAFVADKRRSNRWHFVQVAHEDLLSVWFYVARLG